MAQGKGLCWLTAVFKASAWVSGVPFDWGETHRPWNLGGLSPASGHLALPLGLCNCTPFGRGDGNWTNAVMHPKLSVWVLGGYRVPFSVWFEGATGKPLRIQGLRQDGFHRVCLPSLPHVSSQSLTPATLNTCSQTFLRETGKSLHGPGLSFF